MNENRNIQDIAFIKDVMSKSTKFNSISGFSGIFAGVYFLIGVVCFELGLKNTLFVDVVFLDLNSEVLTVLLILFIVFILSAITLVILTLNKAKKTSQKAWTSISKKLIINFAIPFLSGVGFIFLSFNKMDYELISALMLIFYGFTLVNGSKYTLGDLRSLGILEIVIGLLSAMLPSYSYPFFILGFGVLNIVYGTVLHFKYDRN